MATITQDEVDRLNILRQKQRWLFPAVMRRSDVALPSGRTTIAAAYDRGLLSTASQPLVASLAEIARIARRR